MHGPAGVTRTISIRAPAKGATHSICAFVHDFPISIRAPAKGATLLSVPCNNSFSNFNPRSREGSDRTDLDWWRLRVHFNPRSREGSDIKNCGLFHFSVKFQSALPRRERQYGIRAVRPLAKFQSALPRRERRAEYVHTGYRGAISIRAPAKGATSAENGGKHFIRISIRAPAKGATFAWLNFSCSSPNFNPRSREGSDC